MYFFELISFGFTSKCSKGLLPYVRTGSSGVMDSSTVNRGEGDSGMVNGSIQTPGSSLAGGPPLALGSQEELLHQMSIIIQENKELKEALKQADCSTKERFEALLAWKEKQERETALMRENETLRAQLCALENTAEHLGSEPEGLKALLARLQAEKHDLLAINSELQLKLNQSCPEDLVEIHLTQAKGPQESGLLSRKKDPSAVCTPQSEPTKSRLEGEEMTVSRLLQSLREETEKVEKFELELQDARRRIEELEQQKNTKVESKTQTTQLVGERGHSPISCKTEGQTVHGASLQGAEFPTEVDSLKVQMRAVFQDLQSLTSRLEDTEDMKKNLHDKCRDLEQDRVQLRAQLVGKHVVEKENKELKLKLEKKQQETEKLKQELMEKQQDLQENELLKLKLVEKQKEIEKLKQKLMEKQRDLEENEQLKLKLLEKQKETQKLRQELVDKQQDLEENEQLKLKLVGKQKEIEKLKQEVVDKQQDLDENEQLKLKLLEKQKETEKLKREVVDKQQVLTDNEQLKLQLEEVKREQTKAEQWRKNFTQLKEAYTLHVKDSEEKIKNNKEEMKNLCGSLSAAEEALAAKQQKIDEMKVEIFKKEQELETISLFKAQAEVYSSDFYAERAAREKIHEEKERLMEELELLKEQNCRLQEEMEGLGRQSLNELQRRHKADIVHPRGVATLLSSQRAGEPVSQGGADLGPDEEPLTEYICPKCQGVHPDLDSLQIHIMECIT